MAIEVHVPKEITDYQEKIIAGLSIRKLIVIVISSVFSILVGFFFTSILGIPIRHASWVIIVLNLPILSFGWIKRYNLTFEQYTKIVLRYHLSDGVRLYRTKEGDDR